MSDTSSTPVAAPKLAVVPPAAKADATAPKADAKVDAKAPAKAEAAKTEAAKEIMRMLKLKVDGLDEVELPEAEILKLAAHNAKTLMQAKKHADDHDTLLKRLKEDPEAVLAELGHDPDKRAIERVNKKVQAQIDDESLTPEQKELRLLRAEKEARAKADEERSANEKKTAREKEVEAQKHHLANVIVEALKQTTLPQGTPDETLFTTQLLAKELERSIKNKLFVNPAILAKQTEEMFKLASKPVLSKMQAEHLAEYLGPDAHKALVKLWAQKQGLMATAKPEDGKKPQTAADKRAAERAATQDYFGGTRRAWRR